MSNLRISFELSTYFLSRDKGTRETDGRTDGLRAMRYAAF